MICNSARKFQNHRRPTTNISYAMSLLGLCTQVHSLNLSLQRYTIQLINPSCQTLVNEHQNQFPISTCIQHNRVHKGHDTIKNTVQVNKTGQSGNKSKKYL